MTCVVTVNYSLGFVLGKRSRGMTKRCRVFSFILTVSLLTKLITVVSYKIVVISAPALTKSF